jgi:hypothetical protein
LLLVTVLVGLTVELTTVYPGEHALVLLLLIVGGLPEYESRFAGRGYQLQKVLV